MADITFEIKEHICALTDRNNRGMRKELNLVSWNGHEAKYDIRDWNEDYTKCGKGVTLSYEELATICSVASEQGIC